MSFVLSFLLLIFLLISSLHASNARQLSYRVADKEDRAKKVIISSKDNELSKFEPSMSKELKHNIRHEDATTTTNKKELKGSRKGKKDGDRHLFKRKVSSKKGVVTWRLPDKKGDDHEHQPGFNLDYSPPKTHPPHHN